MKLRRDKLDIVFSLYIRTRDGFRCRFCKRTGGIMDCAHIFSRRHAGTRHDPANAICLCRGCHMRFTTEPMEFADWVLSWMPKVVYEKLRINALSVTKFTAADRAVILADLKTKLKALGHN